MTTQQAKIKLIIDTIQMLERVRDNILQSGAGASMSDDIFNSIDKLYSELLELLGNNKDNNG